MKKMKNRLHQNKSNYEKLVSQPFFSIIVTTYNRAQLLKRALNSLIIQTEEDWEAIIIDDGSTDDTFAQILPFLRSSTKIKYLRKEHSGEAISKNEGILSSGAKFVSFLDSDDEFHPAHLESRKAILLENPSVKFLHGGVRIIGNQYVSDRFDYTKKVNLKDCVIGGTFFIEKDILSSVNGFRDILVGTDADLFDRIKMSGITMMETRLPTYIYHHENEDSITNKLYLEMQLFNE
jgi:glycosyltransferase involved in cell wall biosynthesis